MDTRSGDVRFALFIDDGTRDCGAITSSCYSAVGDQEFTEASIQEYGSAGNQSSVPPVTQSFDSNCPRRGLVFFEGYEAFKGNSDGGWENNGVHAGLNFGTRLGSVSELTGIGFQIGGSAAAYDWSGADYRLTHQNQAEPQGFVTYGLFRKPSNDFPWSAAVVQDWMINANYGVDAENPTLSQVRFQLGFAPSAMNEVGVWGAVRVLDDTRNVPTIGSTTWRPLDQLNAYWHHKWEAGGADTWLWIGAPEQDRFFGNGSLGDWIAGALANVPLNDRVGLYAMVSYMHASGRAGPAAAPDEAWDFIVGLTFYPRSNARSDSIAGQCWMPELPVANNGTFLVDGNRRF